MMKRIALLAVLASCFFTSNAQVNTYRQNINQEIRKLVVSGNCFVHLQRDTCNWVSYQSTSLPESSQMVVIEGNVLTTTEAANGKMLYVGTSVDKGSQLDITVEGNAVVLYDGKYYTKSGVSSQCANDSPTRNWMGIRKYGPDDRIFLDYYFGSCFWNTTSMKAVGIPIYPSKMSSLSHTGVKIGYSLYMDDHVAAGFGIQYGFYSPQFKSPLVSYSANDNRLFSATSDSAGTWNTAAFMHTVGIPLHFTYFPIPKKHGFNLQLELIPQFSFGHKLQQYYIHETTDLTINNTYTKDLPYSLLNLTARFSINYGSLGLYTEYGINPISRNIRFDDNTISPHYVCVGIRINIFELGRD